MAFTALPAIKGRTSCLTCGCGSHDTFSMESIIAAGFGSASVTRDNEEVYDEQSTNFAADETKTEPKYWTGADAERVARLDPDHDWRIRIFAPLYDAVYQRQSENHWVLVERGDGFA